MLLTTGKYRRESQIYGQYKTSVSLHGDFPDRGNKLSRPECTAHIAGVSGAGMEPCKGW